MRSAHQQAGGHGVPPRVLNLLAKQQYELVKNPANGIIFYQNEDGDVLDIQADIIGPVQTAYEGGIFRCKLVIESGFPQNAPKGFFLTKIFHPNVAQNTGEICVNTLKRDWKPSDWSLKHIFEVIKCLLIVPFPESSLNQEAGREFMDDYESFCEHARVYTQIHAKVNAAQKQIIRQRQIEEEKQSTATSSASAAKASAVKQYKASEVSPAKMIIQDLQQLDRQQLQRQPQSSQEEETSPEDSLMNGQVQQESPARRLHAATKNFVEESKLQLAVVGSFTTTAASSSMSPGAAALDQKQPAATSCTSQQQQPQPQPVLSQVTNNSSLERFSPFTAGVGGATGLGGEGSSSSSVVMVKPDMIMTTQTAVTNEQLMDHENNRQHSLYHLAAVSKLLPQNIILTSGGRANGQHSVATTKTQSVLMSHQFPHLQQTSSAQVVCHSATDGSGLNLNSMLSRPALIRRPSVLYKKKSETAKQRQERYIRRV